MITVLQRRSLTQHVSAAVCMKVMLVVYEEVICIQQNLRCTYMNASSQCFGTLSLSHDESNNAVR